MIFGVLFWWACALIWAGGFVLVADLLADPAWRNYWFGWRAFCLGAVLALVGAFTFGVAFRLAPLQVRASALDAIPGTGTKIGPIEWKPDYYELTAAIKNPTDQDYRNFDVLLTLDVFAVEVAQLTRLPGVTVFKGSKSEVLGLVKYYTDGSKRYVGENGIVLFSKEIRILCDRLPRHTDLVLIIAAAQPAPSPNEDFSTSNRVFEELKEAKPNFGQKVKPTRITFSGTYESFASRPRQIITSTSVTQE